MQRVGLEPTPFVGKRSITHLRHLFFSEQRLGKNNAGQQTQCDISALPTELHTRRRDGARTRDHSIIIRSNTPLRHLHILWGWYLKKITKKQNSWGGTRIAAQAMPALLQTRGFEPFGLWARLTRSNTQLRHSWSDYFMHSKNKDKNQSTSCFKPKSKDRWSTTPRVLNVTWGKRRQAIYGPCGIWRLTTWLHTQLFAPTSGPWCVRTGIEPINIQS